MPRWGVLRVDRVVRREDPTAARQVIEGVLPDEGLRRSILGQMVDDIVAAHCINPASWETTLRESGFTLNVGRVWLFCPCRLGRWSFAVLVDQQRILEDARQLLELDNLLVDWSRSPPGAAWVRVLPERFHEVFPLVREAHKAIIPEAARQHRRTPYYIHHSPGVLRYLRAELERDVPDPAYAAVRSPNIGYDIHILARDTGVLRSGRGHNWMPSSATGEPFSAGSPEQGRGR